ncbi:MAG: tRNA (adenosine(37)-N6)-dimethylallyltransferase MiaA [Bacteroidetes bacterium HGW-Bacteroidetes-21]|jgi:tRNA dimethylallyltransferase|nr:MAG: tRNA (adenosine(37)-N6)-dimethylallyltransferase MiaA [Bacteroidetes bacterium HGW-Bacteroidetes-21]
MQTKKKTDLIVILGPTATGKTRIAALLADRLNTCVISADSRQVYRRMDIGTGKDYADYQVEGKNIPAHLIDIVEPGYKYNLFEYQRDFHAVYTHIKNEGKTPILCGGSGLYIDCLLRNYDLREVPRNIALREKLQEKPLSELKTILASYKNLHNESDVDTVNRALRAIEIADFQTSNALSSQVYPAINYICFGIDCEREIRRQRITERLLKRAEEGLVAEVEGLMNEGLSYEDLEFYGLEYKYTAGYIRGDFDKNTFLALLETAIHQFAKRQMTFFRSMEKKGIKINWISRELTNEEIVDRIYNASEIG